MLYNYFRSALKYSEYNEMVKQRTATTVKAAAVSKICHKCKRVPASTSNLCSACITFLSRIFAPDAPLIDQELAKILNTVRSSGRERSVKNLATSLSNSHQELKSKYEKLRKAHKALTAVVSQIETKAAARVRQNFKEKASQTIVKSNFNPKQIRNLLDKSKFLSKE